MNVLKNRKKLLLLKIITTLKNNNLHKCKTLLEKRIDKKQKLASV